MGKTLKNTSLYLLQIGISGVLLLVLLPITAHYLSPNELGQFVLVQVWMGFLVGLANLGLVVGYERNFFVYEKTNKAAPLLSSALLFVLNNLVIIFVFLWIFEEYITQLILEKTIQSHLLLWVFIGSAFNALAQYYLTFFKNTGLANRYIQFVLLQASGNFLIVVFLLLLIELKVEALAYGWAVSNVMLFFGIIIIYHKKLPFSFDKELLKEMLKISLPLTPKVFFGVLNTHFDKIMLGAIGSHALVGVYHIGQTIALMIFQFMAGLHRAFKPTVYRKLFTKRNKTHPNEINDHVMPFFHLSVFIALLFSLFAKEAIIIFFPVEYLDAVIVIIILSIYYAVIFFFMITGTQLIQAKKTIISMYLTPLGMLINIGLNIPFILYWGIIGAAWATVIGGVFVGIIGFLFAQKYNKIHWDFHSIFTVYLFFLLSALFSMLDNMNIIEISNYFSLLIKVFLVIAFILMALKNKINKQIMVGIFKQYQNKN